MVGSRPRLVAVPLPFRQGLTMTIAEFIAALRKAGVKDTDRIDYMDFVGDHEEHFRVIRLAFEDPNEPAEVRVEG